jgi:hypothetical protein
MLFGYDEDTARHRELSREDGDQLAANVGMIYCERNQGEEFLLQKILRFLVEFSWGVCFGLFNYKLIILTLWTL